jgi:hypothetical protein
MLLAQEIALWLMKRLVPKSLGEPCPASTVPEKKIRLNVLHRHTGDLDIRSAVFSSDIAPIFTGGFGSWI